MRGWLVAVACVRGNIGPHRPCTVPIGFLFELPTIRAAHCSAAVFVVLVPDRCYVSNNFHLCRPWILVNFSFISYIFTGKRRLGVPVYTDQLSTHFKPCIRLQKTPFFGQHLEYFILRNNLSISYFHIRWVTTRWNRLLLKFSNIQSSRLKLWFNSGNIISLYDLSNDLLHLLLTLHRNSVCNHLHGCRHSRTDAYIAGNSKHNFLQTTNCNARQAGWFTCEKETYIPFLQWIFQQVLSVIVPGVNLPLQDIAYLLPAIFISAILHELGHAIAAMR